MRIMDLRTERIVLRRLTADDVDDLVELDSDPEVMRFLTNGRPTPREVIADEVLPAQLRIAERFPALGRWAAEDPATGAFLGWFALDPAEDGRQAELGYRLRRAVWGRGLATEGSRALVAYGLGDLGLDRVWAQTMAVNTASRRVLEKAGLRYVRTFHVHFDDPIPGTELGEVEYERRR
ncbi:MAG TPA: GNAT family N-acetyltransferase [Micromonosporaceae bacterium]|nr:GNAT family N-acetyltransferase [Micromonosporaceae bacterium]